MHDGSRVPPMSQYDPNGEFAKLLSGRAEVDLVHFMLEVAEDAYPQLDRVGCLMEIDRLGVSCHDQVERKSCGDVRDRLTAISTLLYEVEGFHGNRESYYEPQNSYLNDVLSRRCGIPISLGILYMAVAARAGLRMFGVNTPGHFVIGSCCGNGSAMFVDPFNHGDVLDWEACRCRIDQVTGRKNELCREHFRAAAPTDIAARVLQNLKAVHSTQENWPQLLRVQQRLTALLPQIPQESRDLGLVYLRLGQPQKALPMLEKYLRVCGSEQAAALQPSLQAAKRMLAESN
jgi:regulator of sirC expression with transglutaminase-like and TPR domain